MQGRWRRQGSVVVVGALMSCAAPPGGPVAADPPAEPPAAGAAEVPAPPASEGGLVIAGEGGLVIAGESGAAIPAPVRIAVMWGNDDADPPVFGAHPGGLKLLRVELTARCEGDGCDGHDKLSLGPDPSRLTLVLPADPGTFRFPNVD